VSTSKASIAKIPVSVATDKKAVAADSMAPTANKKSPSESVNFTVRSFDNVSGSKKNLSGNSATVPDGSKSTTPTSPTAPTAKVKLPAASNPHNIPSGAVGWEQIPAEAEAETTAWRIASMNKTLRADDDGLGAWLDAWTKDFYAGVENPPKLNDLYGVMNSYGNAPPADGVGIQRGGYAAGGNAGNAGNVNGKKQATYNDFARWLSGGDL